MKIAQIVCVFPPYKSGTSNVAYHFARLSAKNNFVTVFTPDYGNLREQTKEKFAVRLKPFLKYGKGAVLPQLLFRLRGFDIVYLHYPFFGSSEIVWLAKIFYQNKFFLIIHYHMDAPGLSWFGSVLSWPAKLILKSLFAKANAITCASIDYVKNSSISEIYKKHSRKFYEIPFGVDIRKFYPAENKFSEPLGKSKNLQILFVGALDRAHYFKGVDVLLKAASGLKYQNWRLNIVGKGDLKSRYEKLAKRLNIYEKVNFLDNVSNKELPKVYRRADLFVLPSVNRNEAFGLVLLEAMASGVPVIASFLPGVRSVFQDKVQGLLAKAGDARELKNKIEQLLSDNNKRLEMGRKGRELVKKKYSWEKVGEKLNFLYQTKCKIIKTKKEN